MQESHRSEHVASAYGQTLTRKYGAEDGPAIVTRSLPGTELAVTELRVHRPHHQLSDPIPQMNAYMITLMISDLPGIDYWEEGRQVPAYSLRGHEITIHDLRREPRAIIDKPLHSLLFYLPFASFDMLADQAGVPRITELRHKPGVGVFDDQIKHMGLSLLPALQTPERVSRLFTDHMMLGFAAHCAQAYGGMATLSRPLKGGLAPWQERRAKEMLAADLSGMTPLATVAEACGLSVSHFSRAFRKSTGLPPHAWLLRARVECAMTKLRGREGSISEIALDCGFADHSHFTRVFSRLVGIGPAEWRRDSVN